MGPIGTGIFLLGSLPLLIAIILFLLGVRSRGTADTAWGSFSGPVWFILLALGIVMMAAGLMSPV
jgi:hypothetical protein